MWKSIIIGIVAGIISGLFSTGGGMILVPAFNYLLKMSSVESRATSIACILPMVITSGIFYYKNNYIDWNISVLVAIGGVIGGYFGSRFLNKIPEWLFKLSFGTFIIYIAFNMIGVF